MPRSFRNNLLELQMSFIFFHNYDSILRNVIICPRSIAQKTHKFARHIGVSSHSWLRETRAITTDAYTVYLQKSDDAY